MSPAPARLTPLDREALRAHRDCVRWLALDTGETVDVRHAAPQALPPEMARIVGPHRMPPAFVAELRDVTLIGPAALAITADDRPVLESALGRHDVLASTFAETPLAAWQTRQDVTATLDLACSLVNLWSGTYFHAVEAMLRLPGLAAYEQATGERPVVLVEANAPDWKLDALAAVGIGRERIVRYSGGPLRVRRLVIPSNRRDAGRTSTVAVEWLRRRVHAHARWRPGDRMLWISRGPPLGRQVLNEAELLDRLRPLGVDKVRLETMSFVEQLRLLRAAPVLIGPHGAGLTNVAFAQSAALVELAPVDAVNNCFFGLAAGLGRGYLFLTAEREGIHLRADVEATVAVLAALRKSIDTPCVSVA